MKKILRWIGIGLLVALIILQFIPVDRSNPPVVSDVQTSAELKTVLKRACYDCHSNETVWPWYSYVAPISMFVADHVEDGRKELNFSDWDNMSVRRKKHKLEETKEMIEKGEMPLPSYLPMHPEAELSDDDKQLIYEWVAQEMDALSASPQQSTERETEEDHDDEDHDHEH